MKAANQSRCLQCTCMCDFSVLWLLHTCNILISDIIHVQSCSQNSHLRDLMF
jgi:hypothetical protein